MSWWTIPMVSTGLVLGLCSSETEPVPLPAPNVECEGSDVWAECGPLVLDGPYPAAALAPIEEARVEGEFLEDGVCDANEESTIRNPVRQGKLDLEIACSASPGGDFVCFKDRYSFDLYCGEDCLLTVEVDRPFDEWHLASRRPCDEEWEALHAQFDSIDRFGCERGYSLHSFYLVTHQEDGPLFYLFPDVGWGEEYVDFEIGEVALTREEFLALVRKGACCGSQC